MVWQYEIAVSNSTMIFSNLHEVWRFGHSEMRASWELDLMLEHVLESFVESREGYMHHVHEGVLT